MYQLKEVEEDDEEVEFFIDDTSIGHASHDEHGWAGMELANKIVANFAEAFNLTVIDTYDEGEEE